MLGLELAVTLAAVILLCDALSRRLGVAPPILGLGFGVLLGLVPGLAEVHLPPEVVLLLFLPALLYWESLTTSLREIRTNIRGIVLTSTVLVVLTAAAVATVLHLLGLPWGPAWVLGAAVAPTDATAVGILARSLPRRTVTTLRAESLVNDGTALVVFALAVTVTTGEGTITPLHVVGLVLLSYLGGGAAGLVTAWLATQLRRRALDALQENMITLLTPFAAYLIAELIGASGVIAVVVCGLTMSQIGPRVGRPETRIQTTAVWDLGTGMLNGALFVLVGLEFVPAVRRLTSVGILQALVAVAAVTAVLVVVRIAFLFGSAYLIRLIDRRPQQRLLRVSNRARIVSGLSGFRGAVSLAVALSVPATAHSGGSFPDRDLIVFVTAGVIAATLIGQGAGLPRVVRWARLPRDAGVAEERHLAQIRATEAALVALPQLAAQLGTDPDTAQQIRREYENTLRALRDTDGDPDGATAPGRDQAATELRRALIARKRDTVLALRDQQQIDDIVMRQILARLDIEAVRLTPQLGADGME